MAQPFLVVDKWVEAGVTGIEFNGAYMPVPLRCKFCEGFLPIEGASLEFEAGKQARFQANIQFCRQESCRTLVSMTPKEDVDTFKPPTAWDLDHLIFRMVGMYGSGEGRLYLNKFEASEYYPESFEYDSPYGVRNDGTS